MHRLGNQIFKISVVIDEWDTNENCKSFETHKRVMARAESAESGKSYACKFLGQLGHNVLFVCPTYKLVRNSEDNGVTLNPFFSFGMSEGETNSEKI